MNIELRAPWLVANLGDTFRAVSWAPHRSGIVQTRRVAWREVRDADLTAELDVPTWLAAEAREAGLEDSVVMLTSRGLENHHFREAIVGQSSAKCIATVGLGNAERVGHRVSPIASGVGTINVLVVVSAALSEAALLECISIAAEARTAAVLECGRTVPSGSETGTGTDCIVVAAQEGEITYAGKHTDVGEVVGRSVYEAVVQGARDWMAENA